MNDISDYEIKKESMKDLCKKLFSIKKFVSNFAKWIWKIINISIKEYLNEKWTISKY